MKPILFIVALSFLIFCNQYAQQQPEVLKDSFLWLEEVEGEKALQWVKERNSISEDYITHSPEFKPIYKQILEVLNPSEGLIESRIVGKYIYYLRKDDRNELGLWQRMPVEDFARNKSTWENVLDIDSLSASENKRYKFGGAFWLEPENNRCIIRISDEGKGDEELREFDTERKSFIKNGFNIPESNSYLNWIDINHAYVTTTFGDSSTTLFGLPRRLKYWERGTDLSEARTIFEVDSMDLGIYNNVIHTPGNKYEIIGRVISRSNVETYLNVNNELKKLEIPPYCWLNTIFKNQVIIELGLDWSINGETYEKGALVGFDIDEFLAGRREISTLLLPEEKSSIIYFTTTKDFVLVNTMRNMQNKLIAFRYENNSWIKQEIETPDFSSIDYISTSSYSTDYFITYSNFLVPNTLSHGNGFEINKVKSLPEDFDGSLFEVSQEEAISRDGTVIPYFMVYRKGIELDGSNQTLLYGYGGFGTSQTPSYNGSLGPWLERGGIYVLAIIRGGGEFGPSWHQAAVKENRQNAFDDFVSVANDLIDNNVTSPRHLGILGASNGGLLVGATFTQHPELFNAVVCASPILDMKRYADPLGGSFYIDEYGNPDIPEEWEYLKNYSPYHNLSTGKKYPEVLFTTSTNDQNVHPAHARKMAARMKEMGHKVYYYETLGGGHVDDLTYESSAYRMALWYTFLLNKTK